MSIVAITVNGTGDPNPADTVGFAGMLGSMVSATNPWQAVADQIAGLRSPAVAYLWQPIGYPASVFPMQPSVNNARAQIQVALGATPTGDVASDYNTDPYEAPTYPDGPFVLVGYSQGAIVTDSVWKLDIYPEDGVLHHRIADCLAVVNFGDPWRCPGVANGNAHQGIPVPGAEDGDVTGGIGGPLDLTETETNHPNALTGSPTVMSYALPGDLYASAPVGPNPWIAEAPAGFVGTSIYNFVLQGTPMTFLEIAEDLMVPVGMVEEIVNGMQFFSAGTNAPHWQYGLQGCVADASRYLAELATHL